MYLSKHKFTRRRFMKNLLHLGLWGTTTGFMKNMPNTKLVRSEHKYGDKYSTMVPGIINVHEHLQSMGRVEDLLNVMDKLEIQKTILVGSSRFTFTLNENHGFTRVDENNKALLEIALLYPERFEAWPTINPLDADKLDKFKKLVGNGATGLKLYLGHGFRGKNGSYYFHVMPMDSPEMFPVYEFCQDNFLPICFHVNPGPKTPGFAAEFKNVLKIFPDLKVICPHFMLSSIKSSRLREFLDTYSNLYTDISFGHDDYLFQGLKRISRNTKKFEKLFNDYPNRFLFGTDTVITLARFKTQKWIENRYSAYISMLTKSKYSTPLMPGIQLNGLRLPTELLERILHRNYTELVRKKP